MSLYRPLVLVVRLVFHLSLWVWVWGHRYWYCYLFFIVKFCREFCQLHCYGAIHLQVNLQQLLNQPVTFVVIKVTCWDLSSFSLAHWFFYRFDFLLVIIDLLVDRFHCYEILSHLFHPQHLWHPLILLSDLQFDYWDLLSFFLSFKFPYYYHFFIGWGHRPFHRSNYFFFKYLWFMIQYPERRCLILFYFFLELKNHLE